MLHIKRATMLAAFPAFLLGHSASAAVAPALVNILPGPDVLNSPPPRAPQFENTGIWQATPILISGASAYRKGEFLYQDWIYDDRGATTNGNAGATGLARSGRYVYPTNVSAYFENLADLVEVRLKLTPSETAFRLTYNSMSDFSLVGATIALGGTAGVLRTVPFGANSVEPAEVFVTVHGTTAVATDAVTGAVIATFAAAVDTERRQVEVRVPFTAFNPTGKTAVRMAAATGLWDVANNRYLIPGTTATATTPGGAGTNTPNPPAFFNVAYRYNEPNPALSTLTRWRDGVQGSTLAATVTVDGVQTHDLSVFAANVDFVKLASLVDDDMPGQATGVPTSGFINRIYSSRYELVQGVGNPNAPQGPLQSSGLVKSKGCTPTSLVGSDGVSTCVPQFAGRLQPYSLYVPVKIPPATGYGLISDFHGGGDNYQRNPPVTAEREIGMGERGTGSLVYITQGRGQIYWWVGQSGSDMWEATADILRNYKVDPNQWVASGISHGSYSTWKTSMMFPDLYAAAAPHVPCPSAGGGYNGTNAPGGTDSFVLPMVDSLRHIPVIASAGENDGTCGWRPNDPLGTFQIRAKFDALNYEFEWWSWPGLGHQFAMQACNNISPKPCAYTFVQDFLDRIFGAGQPLTRVTDPFHITYSVNEGWNEPLFGMVGDHAYWISKVTVRDPAASPYGKIDVVSHGFGLRDPAPSGTTKTFHTDYALGQNISYHNYNKWISDPNAPIATTVNNQIDITATNVSKVVIDPIRARVDCNAVVNVTSDGPIDVVIHGCLQGDIDLNDALSCDDVNAVKAVVGARPGDANYNARADMNDNGAIDQVDVKYVRAALARTPGYGVFSCP